MLLQMRSWRRNIICAMLCCTVTIFNSVFCVAVSCDRTFQRCYLEKSLKFEASWMASWTMTHGAINVKGITIIFGDWSMSGPSWVINMFLYSYLYKHMINVTLTVTLPLGSTLLNQKFHAHMSWNSQKLFQRTPTEISSRIDGKIKYFLGGRPEVLSKSWALTV